MFWSKSARRAVGLLDQVQGALRDCRPDIYDDVKTLPVADGLREAGRRLDVEVPYGAPLDVMATIAAKACIYDRHQ